MELRHILEILWRRRWTAIILFFAVFLTIVTGSLLITPWYDATAQVLLRRSAASSSILSSIGLQSSGTSSTTALTDTDRADYLALAGVRPVAERVVSELKVTRERTRARIMKAIPLLRPFLRLLGVNVESTEEVMTADDLLDSSVLAMILPRPHVDFEQNESTDLIEIEAVSPDNVQAAALANKMADAFIRDELKRVREDYKGVSKFIEANIERTRAEYQNALKELKDYKEKEQTVNLDTETTNLLQRISDYRKQVSDNNVAIFKDRASISRAESQLSAIPKYQKTSEQMKDNEMVLNLKVTLRDLYLSLAESRTKYTGEHPAVIDIRNKINESKDLLDKELKKIFGSETVGIDPVYQDVSVKLAGYYVDMASLESQNQALPVIIKKYERELMTLPRKSADYAQLQLSVNVTQDIYNSMLKYRYQMGMAESMAVSSIYIVEPAIVHDRNDSKHRHPDLFLNTIIAIVLGAPFGMGAALLIEYLDDSVCTSDDVKAVKHLTYLGSVFMLKKKEPKLINEADPRSPIRESLRTIRNSIRFATTDKPPKSIVVTSSVQDEGKSFFASNLAIQAATEGKKVLLIDGDLRRPGITVYFNVPRTIGLTSFIVGEADENAVRLDSGVEGLSIIPTGPIPPDPARLVESKKMHQLIKDMEEAYDLVIIDSPPILAASDAVILGRAADGVILVIESGKAKKKHIADIMELFTKAGINVIGAALNKVSTSRHSYYYYYQQYK
ncbi:MAG: polysaccharide biosynthesis tyrosine autokinase [Deltaproteobacteria bacterium]|nr:polysaccharide biosynthesis tyrosine autokinase [Deltaproteobacteria bacterium]